MHYAAPMLGNNEVQQRGDMHHAAPTLCNIQVQHDMPRLHNAPYGTASRAWVALLHVPPHST